MRPANGEPQRPTPLLKAAIIMTVSALISLVCCFIMMRYEDGSGGSFWARVLTMAVLVGAAVAMWVLYLRAYIDFRIAEAMAPPQQIEQESSKSAG